MKIIKVLFIVLGVFFGISISAMARGFVVNVPAPSGGDDTTVLQAALDDCMTNHLTGCTIQLSAGTYESQQLIAENFHGTVRGMGMDATILQVLPFQEVTTGQVIEGFFGVNPPSRSNKYPALLIFTSGDIKVSDMTFKVIDHDPVAASWCFDDNQCGQTWLFGLVGVIGTSANLLIERVGFDGGPGTMTSSGNNYNVGAFFVGLSGDQPLTGTFKVVSSRFRNSEDTVDVLTVSDARITMGGSPSEGNFVEGGSQGAAFLDLGNSRVEVSYNYLAASANPWAGVLAGQGFAWIPPTSSQFIIKHNTIKVTGSGVDGIWAIDLGPPSGVGKTADFVISENIIQVAGSGTDPAWAGIDAVFTDGAVISNNRILGSSTYGIALELASKCMVKWNDVRRLAAKGGAIYLDADTSNCTVIGADLTDTVVNQGTDNKLINVDVKPFRWFDRPGHDSLKDRLELRKHHRAP